MFPYGNSRELKFGALIARHVGRKDKGEKTLLGWQYRRPLFGVDVNNVLFLNFLLQLPGCKNHVNRWRSFAFKFSMVRGA